MLLVGLLLALLATGMAVLSPLLGWKLRINLSWMTHGWITTTTILVALALLSTDPSIFPGKTQLSGISFASNVMSIGVMFTAIALQGRTKATVLVFALVASFFLVVTGLQREGLDGWEAIIAQWLFVWAASATLLSWFKGAKPFLLVLGFPVALFAVNLLMSTLSTEHWTAGFFLSLVYLVIAGAELGWRIAASPSQPKSRHGFGRFALGGFGLYLMAGYYLITDSLEGVSGIQAGSQQEVCLTYEPHGYHECKRLSLSRQVTTKRTSPEDSHSSFRGFPTREYPEIRIKDPKADSTVFVRSDHIQVSRSGRTYELFPFTDALHLQIQKEFKEAKTENGRSKDPGTPL